ncbi:MAG: hypothetical protein JKY65_08795, partial [Planctomycetes bacterium]|nr:hypothetical protein [Planctomycetota bacterium]
MPAPRKPRKQTDKDARRGAASAASRGKKDGKMFFGASPEEREGLRDTKDKKGIKLSDLNLGATVDRDSLNAPKKVGEALSLMDMAMGTDEFVPDRKTQAKQRRASSAPGGQRRPPARPGA